MTLVVGVITRAAERTLMALAARVTWLNTELPFATPEHLLWLSLQSRLPYAEVDAIDLLSSDHLGWQRLLDVAGEDKKLMALAQQLRRRAAR